MKQCLREGCDLPATNKFCSRSCAAQVNNHIYPKRPRPLADCARCDNALTGSQKKFCSVKCSAQFKQDNVIASWLAGDWDGAKGKELSSSVKRYLIEQAGYRCSNPECAVPGGFAEINPVTGRCPLEIDHIDGDCYNNSPDNLIVLCPNCHSLTPTFRALNKVSGRKYRIKYRK